MKTQTHIVLLRGVMPSGKNKVPMARLREVLSEAGFGAVRTYIQSGNVLLTSELPGERVGHEVNRLIKENIGAELSVLVRTRDDLRRILAGNPYLEDHDVSRVFFSLFAQTPPAQKVKALLGRDFADEQLSITEEAAYMFIPGTYGRGRLSNNFLEKQLGVTATTRNFNTLRNLVELSRPP